MAGWRALGTPSLAVAGLAGCCAAIVWAEPRTPGGLSPVCPTKLLFGVDCPLCGGLRMMASLLHGDLPGALRYNAVAVVFVVVAAAGLASWAWDRYRGRPVRAWWRRRWTGPVVAVVLAVWFVVRNLPFAPFTGLSV
ncbi:MULTISPECIES: DUF2752 domain-containing protein [Amycolatopsis]|uniref:DUF2752 domain-containing protein n=1 Tax=Amycolatopsis TaxID=1813 RepID=UPI000B8ABD25|nr:MULTISPECIES: DUF2752 domain-containing protein [Amycolatopsis]OXM62019.1 hypothetical protein CF166_33235 [Amycolatopsis sp. KNN50.9b]